MCMKPLDIDRKDCPFISVNLLEMQVLLLGLVYSLNLMSDIALLSVPDASKLVGMLKEKQCTQALLTASNV